MSSGKGFVAGIAGALGMSLLMIIARGLGVHIDMEMLLGSMVTSTLGLGTWILGFALHLAIGAVCGWIYAFCFERLTRRAGAGVGMGYGAVHALLAGAVVAALPYVHPLIPVTLPAPGAFLANLGDTAVISFIALHIVFGAIVGVFYKPILIEHQRPLHV